MALETHDPKTETTNRSRMGRIRETFEENYFSYLLILPTLVFLVLLMWIPFLRGIWMTLYNWPFGGSPTWVGIQNYTYLFGWDPFITSLKATMWFSLTTIFQLVIALAAALAVREISRFKKAITGTFLIAYTVPPLVIGTIWGYLLAPDLGPIFQILTDSGILSETIYWGTNGESAMAVVTFITTWTFWPFMFLILSASLQNINQELYESCRVYGANRLQSFWNITLPHLKSAILVAVSIRLIWNLTKVSQVLQLTNGGPGYDTSILAVLLYRFAYTRGSMGLAYVVGLVLFVVTIVFAFIFIREFEKASEEAPA